MMTSEISSADIHTGTHFDAPNSITQVGATKFCTGIVSTELFGRSRSEIQWPMPCHHYMHGAGRHGLQCLGNLDLLPAAGAVLTCPPLKIQKGRGSPLRVLAPVESR